MPITIRSRLLLLVLSVLLPAVAASGWLIERTYAAERDALERNLRDTSRALSMVVDRELVQRASIARVLAVSRVLERPGPLTPSELTAFEQQARRALQGLSGWVELSSPEAQLVNTRLSEPTRSRPRPPEAPALADVASVGALEPVGGPGGELHAPIVQPVQRDGRTVLNVTITILPRELQSIVDLQRLPPGWIGAVLDKRGAVVARHPGGSAFTGRPSGEDLQQLLAQKREGVFESVSLDGSPVTGYFSTSPQGWSYVTAMPRPQVAGQLPPIAAQLAAGALVMLGVAVLSALWLARRIDGPVLKLQDSARQLQAGEPVAPAETGITELDAVAAALADASRAVQQNQAELERQVADAVAATRAAEQHVSRGQRTEALGRLTGGVAHDFNNLLGVISNSAHLIQRHPAADELRVPLSAVLRSVEAGSRLTQHLVRIAGRHPARPAQLDLRQFLPEVQELMKLVLGKRIELDVSIAPGTAKVTVDASELELALINLSLNARDALPSGGHVWLAAGNASPEDSDGMPAGDYVQISVSDDGAGIAEDVVERVFEPFFTTKGVGQGTGLGLAQVQGFCTQAGGRARLASTQGVGTAVMLLLPAAHAVAADQRPQAKPTAAATPASSEGDRRLNGARVLLVEDNAELASVTSALLRTYGCVVQTARSPAQALALTTSDSAFDVVLSDVVMPGDMDGLGLARELRRRYPALPVVLISGYSSALQAAQEFTVLHKPCTPEQLTAALADALAAPRHQEPAGAAGTKI